MKGFIMKSKPLAEGEKIYSGGVDWAAPAGTPIPEKGGKVVKNYLRKGVKHK